MAGNYYNQYISAKLRNAQAEDENKAQKNQAQSIILEEQYKAIKEDRGTPVSDYDIAKIKGDEQKMFTESIKPENLPVKDENSIINKAYIDAKKVLNLAGKGALKLLDLYDTPRRVTAFNLLDKINRAKKDIETGNSASGAARLIVPIGGDYIAETISGLSNKESVLAGFAKIGARQAEMTEFASALDDRRQGYSANLDDLMATVVGSDNWTKTKNFLDKYTELPESNLKIKPLGILSDKGSVDVSLKEVVEAAIPPLKVVKHWHFLTDIAYQTATDPLTYIPLGAVPRLAGATTEMVFNGFLSAGKKIPGLEPVVKKSAQAMGDLAENLSKSFNKKYPQFQRTKDELLAGLDAKSPALREAKKVLGDEPAADLFQSIEDTSTTLKKDTEVLKEKIVAAQKHANIVPLRQKIMRKLTGAKNMVNDMAQSKNIQEWDGKVAAAMQKSEVDGGVVHANLFKEELAAAMKVVGEGAGFTPEQAKKLSMRISVLRATKQATEIGAEGQKITIEYAKDLEKLLEEATSKTIGNKGKAFEIARDRRDMAVAMTKGNYKTWKNARREAVEKAKLAEKEIRSSANSLVRETAKKYTVERRKVLLDAEKALGEKLKMIRYTKIDPTKKTELVKSVKGEFDSFVKNFEKTTQDKLANEYGEIVGMYKNDMSSKVDDFLTGIPGQKEMGKDYRKSLNLINKNYETELKSLEKNIKGLKFADIYNNAMIKYKGVADSVFEKNIANLDEGGKMLAREMRDMFDKRAAEEVSKGLYDLPIAEYYARVLKKQPFLEFDPEAAMNSATGKGAGTAFKKSRVEGTYNYEKFKEFAEKKGAEVMTSARETALTRDLMSRTELARQNIWDKLPDELKVGKARNNMINYLDYVFLGKTPWSKGKASSNLLSRGYDRFTFWNKTILTAFSPTFYFRNVAGFPFLAANEAGTGAFDPRHISEFLGSKTGVTKKISNGKEVLSSEQFYKEMFDRNVTMSSFTRGNIVENARWMLNDFKKYDPRYYMAKALHAGQATEDFGRMYAAFTLFKQGKSLDDAARLARKAMYRFDNFNVIDKTLGGLMTFYSFKRKNLVGTLKNMVNDPKQYALLDRLINNFSTGKQPSDEDLASLNEWDKDKLAIFGDFVKGGQTMVTLGFTPYEDVYQTLSPLLHGDWQKFLSKNILDQMHVPIKIGLMAFGAIKDQSDKNALKYTALPREFLTSPKYVKMIGKVSKVLTGYDVVERDVMRRVNGVPVYEKQTLLPDIITKTITSLPWARVHGDHMRLLQSYADKTGKLPAEITVLDLIKGGEFKDGAGLRRFISGITEKTVDWEYLRRNKTNAQFYRLKNRMEAEGIITPYGIPKSVKAKHYEAIEKANKRAHDRLK